MPGLPEMKLRKNTFTQDVPWLDNYGGSEVSVAVDEEIRWLHNQSSAENVCRIAVGVRGFYNSAYFPNFKCGFSGNKGEVRKSKG
jgi:hypothetical protein